MTITNDSMKKIFVTHFDEGVNAQDITSTFDGYNGGVCDVHMVCDPPKREGARPSCYAFVTFNECVPDEFFDKDRSYILNAKPLYINRVRRQQQHKRFLSEHQQQPSNVLKSTRMRSPSSSGGSWRCNSDDDMKMSVSCVLPSPSMITTSTHQPVQHRFVNAVKELSQMDVTQHRRKKMKTEHSKFNINGKKDDDGVDEEQTEENNNSSSDLFVMVPYSLCPSSLTLMYKTLRIRRDHSNRFISSASKKMKKIYEFEDEN